jgi:hypothetical protein
MSPYALGALQGLKRAPNTLHYRIMTISAYCIRLLPGSGYLRDAEVDRDMADLQRLLFETGAKVNDRDVLATARLTASVKVFAGREQTDSILCEVEAAICAEADRLVADGVLTARPDYLAALVRRRLHVTFGTRAVQQLSHEQREMDTI